MVKQVDLTGKPVFFLCLFPVFPEDRATMENLSAHLFSAEKR